MSLLSNLAELPDTSYHNDWASAKQAMQDWSVRNKFTYSTPCKDSRRARYICTQPGCTFRVTGNKNKDGRVTLRVINRQHSCKQLASSTPSETQTNGSVAVGDSTEAILSRNFSPGNIQKNNVSKTSGLDDTGRSIRNPGAQTQWLVTAIPQVLDITVKTKPADVQRAARQYYNEIINYQQAFRCLRLLTADIKQPRHHKRTPDDLRKAIIALRVFVDPPMDWQEIERKTGVKPATSMYIVSTAERKSGGSKNPLLLLKHATASPAGPKPGFRLRLPEQAPDNRLSNSEEQLQKELSAFAEMPSRNSLSTQPEQGLSQQQRQEGGTDSTFGGLDITADLTQADSETDHEDMVDVDSDTMDDSDSQY